MIILTETNFSKLKLQVKNNSDKKIVFKSDDDSLNRKVMEKLPINTILIPLEGRKDYLKQRDSGFNQVMAKVAKKKNITLGIDLDELINSKNKERILGRIKQDAMLANKNKIKIEFIQGKHKKSAQDPKALLLTLGLHTSLC